jgi:hypothetical protein
MLEQRVEQGKLAGALETNLGACLTATRGLDGMASGDAPN